MLESLIYVFILFSFLFLVALFCAAIELTFDMNRSDSGSSRDVIITWMGLSYHINTKTKDDSLEGSSGDPDGSRTVTPQPPPLGAHTVVGELHRLRTPLFRLFRESMVHLQAKRIELEMTLGLSDPADTGIACGLFYTIVGIVNSNWHQLEYSFTPIFSGRACDIHASGTLRFRLYDFVPAVLRFILEKDVRSIAYTHLKVRLGKRGTNI